MVAFASLTVVLPQSIGFGPATRADETSAVPVGKLTKTQFAKVKGGMTLTDVMALLGPRAEINPDKPPFGYAAPEVLVVWREGKDRWAGVVFVPDRDRVLRVRNVDTSGGTNKGADGLPE
jgi:hypothetical protein